MTSETVMSVAMNTMVTAPIIMTNPMMTMMMMSLFGPFFSFSAAAIYLFLAFFHNYEQIDSSVQGTIACSRVVCNGSVFSIAYC